MIFYGGIAVSIFVVGLCNISCQLCRDLRRLLIGLSPLRGLVCLSAGVALRFTACLISYAPTGLCVIARNEAIQKRVAVFMLIVGGSQGGYKLYPTRNPVLDRGSAYA